MSSIKDQITALIPPGDPHSHERKEFCKAAAEVIAEVMFEHSGDEIDAAFGMKAAFTHGINTMVRLREGKKH